jgi:anti-sigma regulatory factor (Ser/Thr protein kinase)
MSDQGRFRFRTLEDIKSLAAQIAARCPDPERVLFGLSELMINAVEHGNLGISYDEKTALLSTGVEKWRQEVERRLALPENREKFAELELEKRDGELLIVIRDQGLGFDWKQYLELTPARSGDPHGRGVAMARAISFETLEYRGCGNEAVCTVALPPG